jgi:3-keto-5-aminohexanoate cleavage enzyme
MTYNGYEDYFQKDMIVTVATTGGLHGKEANPNLPEQPEEVVEDLKECREAGASVVHLHARDEEGNDTKDVSRFQELRDRINEEIPEMIVCFTSGGRQSREERIAPVVETEPTPDLGTIDLGPMNFGDSRTAINPREQNVEYARRMRENGVKPELEVFHHGQFGEMEHLIDEGLLEEPYWCTLILGMQTGAPAHPRNLINYADNLPDGSEWQCLAIGRHQLPLTTMAMTLGAHVRVGMEDNVYFRRGEPAESNAQLVRRTVRIADELERPIASPDRAREIMGL